MLIKQLAAIAVLVAATAYLYLTRARLGPEPLTAAPRLKQIATVKDAASP